MNLTIELSDEKAAALKAQAAAHGQPVIRESIYPDLLKRSRKR